MSTGDGVAVPSTPTRSGSSAVLSALGTPKSRHDRSPVSTPERPRKRIKLEVKAAPTKEIEELRQSVYNAKLGEISQHNNVYRENLLELFFLQNMGNIMDYFIWRKKPDMKVYQFLKSGQIDSDDEDWCSERSVLSEGLAISSSLFPFNQQTGSSWTPSMLSGQGSGDQRKALKIFGQSSSPLPKLLGISSSTAQSSLESQFSGDSGSQNVSMTSCDSKLFGATVKTEPVSTASTTASGISAILSAAVKSPSVSHLKVASSSSVPESITGTQEAIVERAKQEAAVMQRVSELRRDGMWSSRRLPKVQEPSRGKAHWDYLLEEMQWLAADFAQERKWKKAGARKIASMISKYHKERQMKEMKAEKDEANRTRKIASNLAKMMKDFWGNIEKVVEFKYQSRLEEKRKKAMDLHLSFIVDQTEKYSTWLTEGLATATITPDASSAGGSPTRSGTSDDRDFEPSECDEDDEETILVEEMEAENDESTKEELAELQKEMELPIEELLRSLPQEVLDKPASIPPSESGSEKGESPKAKKRPHEEEEFHSSAEDSDDDEETLEKEEQQEKEQGEMDTQQEINDLQDEGEMTLEELRKKYAGAYDSDFEMPEDSETPSEEDTTSASDTSEEEEEEENVEAEKDVGMEFLVKDLETSKSPAKKDNEPGSQLTDIAATAESIQPTGYTLETTKVRTAIPFLLKHTLREYQVVGLDWMATMYERRLNGILADEMGLGKTIQTIALLAHLACEKGIWGPHLIVVPTSVMLNWELEIKKWCPAFKILTYFGTQKERKAKRTGWTKTNAFHVCITSYKLVIQDHQAFRRKKWKYFILDEAQNIKNFKSQRWQTLLNFSSQRRLLLTGTPLQNNLMELWSLMHFLMPHVFQSHRDFKEWFANPLTGMIEGSREYNESLIKRLHKVLRPFLLRRLKIDVEKQMPKKYEHIVRCHLSRRQRFLYDDFMSQSKTKETLASGHYMSVINILMQLRKVCNHPNLFDPRPILSPFQMEGIAFTTPSIVTKALDKDPLEYIAPTEFHPSLADLELCLPAFVAHRIRLLHTPRKLIEEIDSQPEAPARPPPAEKPVKLLLRSTSPMPPVSGRASPFVPIQHRSNSPMSLKSTPSKSPAVPTTPVTTPSVETTQLHQLPGHTPQIKTSHPAISTPTSVVLSSVGSTSSTATSQPITVQIQNTPQGTRLMIPSGQLSQLPGYIQIVQTASGQQIIATSQPPPNHSSGTTVMNGPTSSPGFTTAGQSSRMAQTSIQLPVTTSVVSSKPVMKVSPLLNSTVTSPSVDSRVSSPLSPKSVIGTRSATRTLPCKAKEKSIFFNESVHEKRTRRRKDTLTYIARRNQHNTDIKPVYGLDLRDAVNVLHETKNPVQSQWQGLGYIHCHKIHNCSNPNHPNVFWKQTEALQSMVHTPEQYLQELHDILDRFTFVVPAVRSPRIVMRTFHPPPSVLQSEIYMQETLHRDVSPKASCLHRIIANTSVQFPEVRLIQYDCGKLQTLDILLRKLKPGDHRALIFTQMTKMLDILEAFLNFHGHRYLRLDGTTKVEQRQALMDRFNADKRIFVFILSTRSGGLGVNLTGADTVIFYDSDWNPTMDAQAQDRCHRIGQTRDVHIYRLISEKTIEENILKKANQKRLLSDVTIEGGNFTTAFFKENTIKELFEEPSGLDAFVKDKNAAEAKEAAAKKIPQVKESLQKPTQSSRDVSLVEESVQEVTRSRPPSRASSKAGSLDQEHLEQVLCTAEDEGDAQAAKIAKAEQSAELAEFDEDIPWDEKEAEQKQQRDKEMSRVEQELSMLEKELTPVERYAVSHMELQLAPVKHNELEKAEENVLLAKEEWELSRLKALKEEEERRAELEEDEMLFTYSREDAANQVKNTASSPRKASVLSKRAAKRAAKRQKDPMPMGLMDKYERQNKVVAANTEMATTMDGFNRKTFSRKRGTGRLNGPNKSDIHHRSRKSALEGVGGDEIRTSKKSRGVVVIVDSGGEEFVTDPLKKSKMTSNCSTPDQPVVNATPVVKRGVAVRGGRGSRGRGSPRKHRLDAHHKQVGLVGGSTCNEEAKAGNISLGKSNTALQQPWSNPNLVIRTRKASVPDPTNKKDTESENGEIDVVSVPSSSSSVNPVLSKLTANLASVSAALAQASSVNHNHAPANLVTRIMTGPGTSMPMVSYVKNIQGPNVSLSGLRNIQFAAGSAVKLNSVPYNNLRTIVTSSQGSQRPIQPRQQHPSPKTAQNTVPILEKMAMQLGSHSRTSNPAPEQKFVISSLPAPAKSQLVQHSRPSFAQVVQTPHVPSARTVVPTVANLQSPVVQSSRPVLQHTQPIIPAATPQRTTPSQTHAIQIGNQIIRLQNLSSAPNQIIQLRSNTGQQHFIQIRQVVPPGGGQPQTVLVNRPQPQHGVVLGAGGGTRQMINSTVVPRPVLQSNRIVTTASAAAATQQHRTVIQHQQPNIVRLQQAGARVVAQQPMPVQTGINGASGQNRVKVVVTTSNDIICLD